MIYDCISGSKETSKVEKHDQVKKDEERAVPYLVFKTIMSFEQLITQESRPSFFSHIWI